MKSTEHFKNTIKAYLDKRANEDELFAITYAKENKNLDDCITFIFNTVQKSGCNGFTDDEVYSMAVHYYDEDSIEVGKSTDCQVVVNHTVELSAEEKEEARRKAIQKAQDEAYTRMKQPLRKPQAKQATINNQLNLFAV
ncbi:MAG: PcfK-like family protein [Candidatus Azobacteroides sp.]|nr:PcfK-like family protein [Candidatus Azobacteroides sp.]